MSKLPTRPSSGAVADVLAKAKALPVLRAGGPAGRLVFALDATASREPLWEQARAVQGEMFAAAQGAGGLEIQLAWYRGLGEFHASPFVSRTEELLARMREVTCAAGETQVARVLAHGAGETRRRRIGALVFVGDAMEENVDALAARAGELGILGVPCFMFLEGADPVARAGSRRRRARRHRRSAGPRARRPRARPDRRPRGT
ncbi:MAG: VWA domain-containing protein [Alphaproteobacteria bacterium]